LTGQSDELPRYYDIGREIVCYRSVGDLIDKIRYFESHERERAAISEAGYQRTHREHTYVHRFTELFQRMGLMTAPAHDILNRPPAEGLVREAA
ncbi:MAG TPA: glycosyltransferase, partial [Elusimicrobiota bacterium]|nr:glycosyltransferase [Elusimicrobiota bacterium]